MKKHPKAWKFYRMYANLPLGAREEVVSIIKGEPLSFHVIKLELDQNTEVGYKALEQMLRLGIIDG